jgi:hypothetical protein
MLETIIRLAPQVNMAVAYRAQDIWRKPCSIENGKNEARKE